MIFDRLPSRSFDRTFTFPHAFQADASGVVLLAPINVASDDKRVIVGDLGWREPPLPFMASDSEQGHGDAVRVGSLTDFERQTVDGTDFVTATVTFDSDAERGDEFARLAEEGEFNGVSIHMGKARFADVIFEDGEWVEVTFEDIIEFVESHTDDEIEAFIDSLHLGAFDAEIAAATQVAIPAFPEARIDADTIQQIADDEAAVAASVGQTLADAFDRAAAQGFNLDWTITPMDDDANNDDRVIVAASLDRPPADWFAEPHLDAPTALTVTDDGRVFGHLALWETCHAGYADQCVRAPKGADYTAFLTARVITDDGVRQPVGPLVVDDGHAPASWGNDRVMAYYADTSLAAAYVNVGEDAHGVWVAGAVSHKATDDQIETLRRHPLSGDWRPSDNGYRLIAAVSVNAPGLPIPEVLVAAGEPAGLITYGPYDEHASDLALVADALEHLGANVVELRQRMQAITDRLDRPTVDAEAEALLEALNG